MKRPFTSICNIVIHCLRLNDVLRQIQYALGKKKPYIIFPINVHILAELIKNPPIAIRHNAADIIFSDGIPLVWLSALTGRKIPERVSGTELTEKILLSFQDIFIIAPTSIILRAIIEKYNKTKRHINGGFCPPYAEAWGNKTDKHIINLIDKTKSRIVLVGVGPLKQERWILENAQKTHARIFMAVGSAFDILSGEKPRSPDWMQKSGLEWLWRIFLEPKRLLVRYLSDIWFLKKYIIRQSVQWAIKSNRTMLIFILLNIFFAIVLLRQYPAETVGYRGNEQRTGVYQSRLFAKTPQWWRFKTDGLLTCAPVVVDNKLYISSWEDFTLYVLDVSSGRLLWEFKADSDLPFAPTIFQNIAYIGSTDGHLYALDNTTGELKWKFTSEKFKSITTHPLIYNNSILFGARDGYMYSLDWKTGKKNWSFQPDDVNSGMMLRTAWPGQVGRQIESSPLVYNGIIYFGSFNGKIYGINATTGTRVWEYQTEGAVLSSPAISGNTLIIGSEDATIYAFRLSDKKLLWKTTLEGSIDSTSAIKNNEVIINTLENKLYAVSLSSGKILWKNTVNTANHSGSAVDGDTIYFGSSDNSLYAFDIKTGKTKWTYTVNQAINAAPSVAGNTVFFTSGWYVYALNKRTGKPFIDPSTASIVNPPTKTTLYDPIEFSLNHNDSLYQNPWNEASVSAIFTSPSNKTIPVDGFYYDHNEWRIRFAPNETGEWHWSISIRPVPSAEKVFSGQFTVQQSENPGFVRISAVNPFHFVFDNGKPFYPLGISDTLLDSNGDGYPLDDFFVDEKDNISLSQYAKEYGTSGAGFNMFRWSVDNASFKLWSTLYSPLSKKTARWDTYPTKNGQWGDELVKTLKNNGIHIWMTIWGFNPNLSMENPEVFSGQTSITTYLRYVVARYGALVDVWELGNEAMASNLWISYVANILTSIDPYHHPISMNWEMPDRPEINITSPHWYHTEPLQETDVAMVNKIYQYKQWQKPIVFGEEGNKYANWDETSGTRMRVRVWAAFFNDASLIFWNTSATKKFVSTKNANIYLGPDERRYIKVFQNTINSISSDYWPATLSVNNAGIRYYSVASDSQLLAYFFHYANPDAETSAQISFYRGQPGSGQFINPENGNVVSTVNIAAGWNTLTIPSFTCDMALKIQ